MTTNIVKKLGVFMVLSLVVAVCVGAGAAADWATYLGNDGRTGYTAEAGPQTNNVLWSVDNPYQKTTDVYWETPSVKDGKVYVSLYYGNSTWSPDVYNIPSVYCFDLYTGEEIWNKTLFAEGGGRAGITIYDDSLYVSGYDGKSKGKLFRLSLDNGEILGQTEFICDQGYYGLTATPLVFENTVWVNTFDYAYTKESLETSSLYGFSLDLKTQVDKEQIPNFAGSIFASPSTDGVDTIYIPGDGGVMKYSVSTGTLESFVNVSANFRDYDGLKWRVSTPVYADGVIYFYTSNVTEYPYTGSLYAYKADGTQVFEKSIVSAVQSSSPAVSNTHIVVGNATGICVYSLDGTEEWFYQTGNSRAQNTPVIADDVAYFGTYTFNDCSVYAVDLTTKEVVWSYKPATDSGMIEGSLAVSDGVLYYGDMLKFYAIGEELPTPPVTTESLYDGTVTLDSEDVEITLTDGTIKTAAGNSVMAAIAKAATTYNVVDKWGYFSFQGFNGVNNNADAYTYWFAQVNDGSVYSGYFEDLELTDGDVLSLYYGFGLSSPDHSTDEATHIVKIKVKIREENPSPVTIYDSTVTLGTGDVTITLADDTTTTVAGNNGIAAIDAAAKAAGFTYTVSEKPETGIGLDGINGIEQYQTEDGWFWWAFYVNDEYSNLLVGNVELNDGDKISLYFCNGNIADATYIVHISVKVTESPEIPSTATVIYDGTVVLGTDDVEILLKDGVTKKVVDGNNGLAAVDAAAKAGEFTYTVSDSNYGLYIEGFNGVNDAYAETGYSWAIYRNGQPSPIGISGISLNNGDVLTFYYCKMDGNYDYLIHEATHVINILAKTADFTITLKEGWNFISVPWALAENMDTAEALFANVDTGSHAILTYNAEEQEWVQVPGTAELPPLAAFWIYSETDNVKIDLIYKTDLSTPASLKLYKGWNQVGIAGNSEMTATKYLDPVENWRIIIPWNKETGNLETPGITKSDADSRVLTPGTGNWLFVGDGDYVVGQV